MARKLFLIVAAAVLVLPVCLSAAQQEAPKPAVDIKKIMIEVEGTYDVEFQGQTMALVFFQKAGKLFGAPEGENPEETVPVKGANPLKFEVTVSGSGQYFEIEFGRNDKGVVDRVAAKSQGIELAGKKRMK